MLDRFKFKYNVHGTLFEVYAVDFCEKSVCVWVDKVKLQGMKLSGFQFDFKNLIQSTGLKDKNGKLIYEGDIIYTPGWWWGAGFVHLNIGECGPCKGDSVMSYILAKNIDNPLKGAAHNIWNGAEVEVIGNIYENPELLEDNK